MSNTAIRVENLGKKYLIRHEQQGMKNYKALRDVIAEKFKRISNPKSKIQNPKSEEFWALKDVSFNIGQGEAVGIIGRNGAGKSTLLKLLSRITEPSTGRIELEGRVSSLLEVGTGFHPELTGRENTYLNGAILGMSRAEIKRKFDEIVAFAEIEKFLDTPVKRYSSGMYVRLAFAVAAHLEPEILIVDEVLAVGDAAFQQKCLGKMNDVAKREGRTVLFVSHNIQAISILCSSAILLKNGGMVTQGTTSHVIDQYLSSGHGNTAEAIWSFDEAPSTDIVKLHAVRVLDEEQKVQANFDMAKPIILQTDFWVLKKERFTVSFWLFNSLGVNLFASANYQNSEWSNVTYEPGLYSSWCRIPAHFLNEGKHHVRVILTKGSSQNEIDIDDVVSFMVDDRTDTRADYTGPWAGLVRPLLPWGGKCIGGLPSAGRQSPVP